MANKKKKNRKSSTTTTSPSTDVEAELRKAVEEPGGGDEMPTKPRKNKKKKSVNRPRAKVTPPSSNGVDQFVSFKVDDTATPFATAIPVDHNKPPSHNLDSSMAVPEESFAPTIVGSTPPSAGTKPLPPGPNPPVASDIEAVPPVVPNVHVSIGAGGTAAVHAGASPPGVPPNGRWVLLKEIGPNTWTLCTVLSIVTCWFMLMPCGLWALLCPCDERLAYLSDGKLYNEAGGLIGPARSRKYR